LTPEFDGEDRPRHLDAEQQGEFPVPVQGEHDLEPASNPGVWPLPVVIQPSAYGGQNGSRSWTGFERHDFGCAAKVASRMRALAPEEMRCYEWN
jgi:hypothetical protein